MEPPDLPPLCSRPPLPDENKKKLVKWNRSVGRLDKRSALQLRPLFIRTGVCQAAIGSCYLSQDNNVRIICSVFGPKPTHSKLRAKLNQRLAGEQGCLTVEVTFSPFSAPGRGRVTRAGGGLGQMTRNVEDLRDEDEARLSNTIVETFQNVVLTDTFPNSLLEISLLVMYSSGIGLTAAAINCVSMALADGGIAMRDLCTSVTVAVYNSHERTKVDETIKKNVDYFGTKEKRSNNPLILMDPTEIEIESDNNNGQAVAQITVGLCPLTSVVVFLDSSNTACADLSVIAAAFRAAEVACCTLGQTFRNQLKYSAAKRKAHEEIQRLDDETRIAEEPSEVH